MYSAARQWVAICVMDAAFRQRTERDCHLQRTDHQVTFHSVAHGPVDDMAGMQIQNYRKIKSTFAGPDITDITYLSHDRYCLQHRESTSVSPVSWFVLKNHCLATDAL